MKGDKPIESSYDFVHLVRTLGGVADVGRQLNRQTADLSNQSKRGYSLPCMLELMALAKSRNVPVPKSALTIMIGKKRFSIVVEASEK